MLIRKDMEIQGICFLCYVQQANLNISLQNLCDTNDYCLC